MTRFEELKQKSKELGGYFALSKEEQTEYQALKNEVGAETPARETTLELKPEVKSEPVDMKAMIDQAVAEAVKTLREENESLKTERRNLEKEMGMGDWKEWKEPAKANKTATLRVYQEDTDQPAGLVVSWKFLKNEWDENSRAYDRAIYKITVLHDSGKTKEYTVPLVDLSKIATREQIEILEMKTKDMVQDQGPVSVAAEKGGYVYSKMGDVKVFDSGRTVRALVHMTTGTAICKRGSGQTFEMDISKLNS